MEVDESRLKKAWLCILPEFFEMCTTYTREHGAGICIFEMLQRDSSEGNCTFHFITRESPLWNDVITNFPRKEKLVEIYDPLRHIVVSVHIPSAIGQGRAVGNVRDRKSVV